MLNNPEQVYSNRQHLHVNISRKLRKDLKEYLINEELHNVVARGEESCSKDAGSPPMNLYI